MRLPKFGFNSAKARTTAEVTLSEVGLVEADVIDVQALIDADLLKGTMKRAKVILSGKIEKAVNLQGIKATKGAKAAIEAAGGSIKE
jgi:large subunit ribosomal protein L15